MKRLYVDTETYGTADLRRAGMYRYFTTAKVLLLSWAIDDGPVKLVDITRRDPIPKRLNDAFEDRKVTVWAHNAHFDRLALATLGVHLHPKRWRCSMSLARLHGYPASLDMLGAVLGLPADMAKLKDGKRLIKLFCSPPEMTEQDHAADWELFREYARQDIDAMRGCVDRMPAWNNDVSEYMLDQKLNDRGVCVDTEFAARMETAVEVTQNRILRRMTAVTGGAVKNGRSPDQCHKWLHSRGVFLPDMTRGTLAALDMNDMPDDIAEFLRLRGGVARAAGSKYSALQNVVSRDGRVRGALVYAGASRTRRWSGKHVQLHNLRSRDIPTREETEVFASAVELQLDDVLYTEEDALDHAGSAVRRTVIARSGRRLAVADLSNVEGRVLAWLTGDPKVLAPFRAYDEGHGPDPYKVTAGDILGVPPDKVTKRDRDIHGKTLTLAGGFGGGVLAYRNGLKLGGVDVEDIAEDTRRRFPIEWDQAIANHKAWGADRNPDVDVEDWIPLETLKLVWRARNPAIVALWGMAGDAARTAMALGGVHRAGRLGIAMQRHAGIDYLRVFLPSNKSVLYQSPRLADGSSFHYNAVNAKTGRWTRHVAYPGKIIQNATQSLARDIMAHGLWLAENDSELTPVLTVHDEIICECDEPAAADRLAGLMASPVPWAEGLPLAAKGTPMDRYGKN